LTARRHPRTRSWPASAGAAETGGPVSSLDSPLGGALPLSQHRGRIGSLLVHAAPAPRWRSVLARCWQKETGGWRVSTPKCKGGNGHTASSGATEGRSRRRWPRCRHGMAIHERLHPVTAAGEGRAGSEDGLHDLERDGGSRRDVWATVRWAGQGRPDRYPKPRLRAGEDDPRLMTGGGGGRAGGPRRRRVVALARKTVGARADSR